MQKQNPGNSPLHGPLHPEVPASVRSSSQAVEFLSLFSVCESRVFICASWEEEGNHVYFIFSQVQVLTQFLFNKTLLRCTLAQKLLIKHVAGQPVPSVHTHCEPAPRKIPNSQPLAPRSSCALSSRGHRRSRERLADSPLQSSLACS